MDKYYYPSITIIIAVLNCVDTLQRAIDSVLRQSYNQKNLIIIDGGSTDGTVNVIESNEQNLAYWESQQDRGIGHAWNKGLDKSQGEWIIFIGADDQFHDESVLSDMSIFLRDDIENDLVYGQIIYGDGVFEGKKLGQPFDWNIYKRRMLIPHTGCFHRKTLFNEIGVFDETFKIALDYEIFLRKKTIMARYISRLVTIMGGKGLSTNQAIPSLREARLAQLKNKVDSKIKIEFWHFIYRLRNEIEK